MAARYNVQVLTLAQAQALANTLEMQDWACRVVPYSDGTAQVVVDGTKVWS